MAARTAARLFCASLVVAEATVERIRQLRPAAVTFVITGAAGHADEDLACAEYLAARLSDAQPSPGPFLARVETAGQDLLRGVTLGYEGVHPDDLARCMGLDRFTFAMVAANRDDQLVLTKA